MITMIAGFLLGLFGAELNKGVLERAMLLELIAGFVLVVGFLLIRGARLERRVYDSNKEYVAFNTPQTEPVFKAVTNEPQEIENPFIEGSLRWMAWNEDNEN